MLQLLNRQNGKIRSIILILALVFVAACSRNPQERAQRHYEQGAKLLAQNDPVKAAIEFKNALQQNAEHLEALRGLGQIEESNRNWRGLVPILRKIVDLDQNDIETKLKLARLLLLGNALEDTLKLANAALEINPQHVGALALKAAVLVKLNDDSGAIAEAEKALAIEPGNAEALMVVAATKMSKGDNRGALETLQRAPVGEKPNIGVEFFKIQLLERIGDVNQIEALLRNLVDAYPQEMVFRRQLISVYVAQKRLDEAEKELRAIAAADPSSAELGLNVVRFLNSYRSPAAARQELLARIGAGGQVFPYQIALAEFDFTRGNAKESIALLEKLINSTETSQENVLAAQIKLAELHVAARKIEEAEKIIAEILRKDSRNTTGLRLRAAIRMERGELDPAIADLRQALNDQPRATEIMIPLAIAYERNGAIELADKQYAEAIRVSGFNARLGLSYVSFLQRRGNAARAEDILSELARRWPNNIHVLAALANVKLQHQDWAGAEEIANSIRRLGNTQEIADQIFGEVLGRQQKFDESIEVLQAAYSRSAETSPGTAQPMLALVRAFVRANKPEEAASFLRKELTKNPNNAEALVLLGSVQLMQKQTDEATRSFTLAIERQPKNTVGYRALGNLRIQQKNYDDALKVIHSGLKEQPKSVALRMMLAGAFELKKDYDSAIKEYEALLEDQPNSMIVVNNLASLLSDHRSDAASLDRANSLIAILQKSPVPQFKDTVGWVQYRRGEYRAATTLLEQAATELPNAPLVRYHLGMSYLAVGQTDKAQEQLQQARKLAANDEGLQEKVRAALKQAGVN
jgi:tetratricopeptide (TPR) repeat protein